jgi:peroxiredoxin
VPVDVGAEAPDFTLQDQSNQSTTLSAYRDYRNVLLVFFPFAFSGICTGELCSVRDDLSAYQNEDVQTFGISVDSPFALRAFAAKEGYSFPLLADFWPHGEVARRYGVFIEQMGIAARGTVLIDKAGIVRFTELNGPGEPRDSAAWRAALKQL